MYQDPIAEALQEIARERQGIYPPQASAPAPRTTFTEAPPNRAMSTESAPGRAAFTEVAPIPRHQVIRLTIEIEININAKSN